MKAAKKAKEDSIKPKVIKEKEIFEMQAESDDSNNNIDDFDNLTERNSNQIDTDQRVEFIVDESRPTMQGVKIGSKE